MNPHPLLEKVKYDAQGLVSAIAQDHATGRVLMLAYMNAETLRETLETGVMTYWSRSRQQRWVKGETSGHVQHVRAAYVDCDGDALLFEVEQVGRAACHTGHASCFFRQIQDGRLEETEPPVFDPERVYGA